MVKVGSNPNVVLYDPPTKRVFTFNVDDHSATVIDANEGKVVGTIELGGNPEFAAPDDKGHLFVNLSDKDEVLQIDSRKMSAGER